MKLSLLPLKLLNMGRRRPCVHLCAPIWTIHGHSIFITAPCSLLTSTCACPETYAMRSVIHWWKSALLSMGHFTWIAALQWPFSVGDTVGSLTGSLSGGGVGSRCVFLLRPLTPPYHCHLRSIESKWWIFSEWFFREWIEKLYSYAWFMHEDWNQQFDHQLGGFIAFI